MAKNKSHPPRDARDLTDGGSLDQDMIPQKPTHRGPNTGILPPGEATRRTVGDSETRSSPADAVGAAITESDENATTATPDAKGHTLDEELVSIRTAEGKVHAETPMSE